MTVIEPPQIYRFASLNELVAQATPSNIDSLIESYESMPLDGKPFEIAMSVMLGLKVLNRRRQQYVDALLLQPKP